MKVIRQDELPFSRISREFVGDDHGDAGVCLILVDAPPGRGPGLHKHPYRGGVPHPGGRGHVPVGRRGATAGGGRLVVVPAEIWHGFTATGDKNLRMVTIHPSQQLHDGVTRVGLTDMDHRRLGDSDLEVSVIALGSWLTYSGGIGREQTEACTRAAFDAGITFFDTANVYGRGAAETAWGEILSDYPRDSYMLATKVYFPMGGRDRGLSREQILKQIDGSLARLQTDHVDLYQCHRYDDDMPLEETMGALTEVVEAGKARYIGFSEWPADRIEAALTGCPAWRSSCPASRSTRRCGGGRRPR